MRIFNDKIFRLGRCLVIFGDNRFNKFALTNNHKMCLNIGKPPRRRLRNDLLGYYSAVN